MSALNDVNIETVAGLAGTIARCRRVRQRVARREKTDGRGGALDT